MATYKIKVEGLEDVQKLRQELEAIKDNIGEISEIELFRTPEDFANDEVSVRAKESKWQKTQRYFDKVDELEKFKEDMLVLIQDLYNR